MLERQRAGMSLAAAIRQSVGDAAPVDASLFAAVTQVSGRTPVRRSRRTMLAFSRAIEDACLAAGGSTVIVGSFQREDVFRECEGRWREIARGAALCVALADFAEVGGSGSIVEVPVTPSSPLRREWSVAVAGPRLWAVLAGWEWPEAADDGFEALWSVEPHVVTAAVEHGIALARAAAPDRVVDVVLPAQSGDGVVPAMALIDRVLSRLDR